MKAEIESSRVHEVQFFENLFRRIATDLAMILEGELTVVSVETERAAKRVAGEGSIHISFKLCVEGGGETLFGCVLVPFADAVTLAGLLLMLSAEEVETWRRSTELDATMKDAILELGNFVAGAADATIRTWYPRDFTVRSAGCQGVRAGVRPAFPYVEGSDLAVGRARAHADEHPEFEMIAMLPLPPGS